jgi:hypothetical protein
MSDCPRSIAELTRIWDSLPQPARRGHPSGYIASPETIRRWIAEIPARHTVVIAARPQSQRVISDRPLAVMLAVLPCPLSGADPTGLPQGVANAPRLQTVRVDGFVPSMWPGADGPFCTVPSFLASVSCKKNVDNGSAPPSIRPNRGRD